MDNDDVSTKSIVTVIIELDILVVRVSSSLGCKGRPYFGDERFFFHKDDVSTKFIVIVIVIDDVSTKGEQESQ